MTISNAALGLIRRQEMEQREAEQLASYACLAGKSQGRLHSEDEHPYRTCYQRDRDRLIHSAAFRRLEYKTQVFINSAGDHYRTRLTHTLEVAQIARTLARMLSLNEDLTEAVALAHDTGHPPFGHAGERVLDAQLREVGGFEHNAQALRIVDALESRYPDFPGLNLTAETRRGILKGKSAYAGMGEGLPSRLSIEAQVVDLADEISYGSHDLDDGVDSGLIRFEETMRVPLWRRAAEWVEDRYPGLDEKHRRHRMIMQLINLKVTDAAEESLRRLREDDPTPDGRFIEFSATVKTEIAVAKNFLFGELYRHPRVQRANSRCEIILNRLFDHYRRNSGQLPAFFRNRIEFEGLERTVGDYIAGMTDRYAEEDYRQLFGF